MLRERVSWDASQQGITISGLESQVGRMKLAKNKIMPELDVLKPNWTTIGSKKTIVDLEMFLTNDFEQFMKIFEIAIGKLDSVRSISEQMNQIQ